MFKRIIFLLCLIGAEIVFSAEIPTLTPSKLQVAYLGRQGSERFEQVKKYFESNKNCSICEIVDTTVYGKEKSIDAEKTLEKWNDEKLNYPIILVDWNEKMNDNQKSLRDLLNKKSAEGSAIVFPAGFAVVGEPTLALNKTLATQVPQALIIGEMTDRERILPNSYYGPEMLTALKLPTHLLDQNYAATVFVTKWVSTWSKKTGFEWPSYFKSKKSKVKKIWLSLDDFFRF